ncbi:hypothetical protein NL676_013052 [Syzygium grande]|nr:hypothetical protein NL676_013052 [Syzygium grande]
MTTQLPDDFRCPISLEIMSDPVILSSGHTFDRASIQRWLDSSHRTCPITKLPLPDRPSLIPDHPSQPHPNHRRPPQARATRVPEFRGPRHPRASSSKKLEALTRLTKLSNRDPAFGRRLTESGTVSVVLNCVDPDNGLLRERALSLLLNLSLDDDNKVGLVAEGAISKIVGALRADSADCRALAATIITSLAVVEVNKATVGRRRRPPRRSSPYARSRRTGSRPAANGSVPVLIRAADSGPERAVEALAMLAKCREGREVMGVERICVEVRRQGVLEMCIRLLEDDNEKIRRNATSLARLLQVDSDCSVR